MLARYCGGEMGRFVAPDPVIGAPVSPQSWNGHAAMGNNPVSMTDATGHMPINPNQEAGGGPNNSADHFGDLGSNVTPTNGLTLLDLAIQAVQAGWQGPTQPGTTMDNAVKAAAPQAQAASVGSASPAATSDTSLTKEGQSSKLSGVPQEKQAGVEESIEKASTRLDNPQCAAALGGAEKANAALDSTAVVFYSGDPAHLVHGSPAVTGAWTTQGGNVIHINSNGPFENPTQFVQGSSKIFSAVKAFNVLTPEGVRELILLHEIGHQTGALPPDHDNPLQSADNTRTVRNACFPNGR